MLDRKIIDNIINRRKNLGVTQCHLAQLSGLSEITIKKIESGKTNPTINTLLKIAEVLGLEIDLKIKQTNI
ncbi:MAG TPA: helix-turn-helix transcriptional regulator [Pyrinomonadaceae bacterium]|nr:helix-turn-helix transcriptional regulator [Pyrinomonadaceae bacterium]